MRATGEKVERTLRGLKMAVKGKLDERELVTRDVLKVQTSSPSRVVPQGACRKGKGHPGPQPTSKKSEGAKDRHTPFVRGKSITGLEW